MGAFLRRPPDRAPFDALDNGIPEIVIRAGFAKLRRQVFSM